MIKQPDTFAQYERDEMDHDLIDQPGLKALLVNARTKEAGFFVTGSLLGYFDDTIIT